MKRTLTAEQMKAAAVNRSPLEPVISARNEVVYLAKNGWFVRRVFYVVIRGILKTSPCGDKWFEIYDAQGVNYGNWKANEASFAEVCAWAERGDKPAPAAVRGLGIVDGDATPNAYDLRVQAARSATTGER